MKKKVRILLFFLVFVVILSACGKNQNGDIVILYTNDIHCAVDSGIGYAGLASLQKQYEADGNTVLLVDCGDAIQGEPIGTLSEGEYIIDIMNAVGYDVAAIGNHEFDYGSNRFLELTEIAQFPYVSCNFRDIRSGENLVEPYVILQAHNKKIAFLGISTPFTITSSSPAHFQDDTGSFVYSFDQDMTGETVYTAVQSAIDSAKKDGADYIIALCHLGAEESFSPWSSTDIIQNTSGIDVLLDAHSHRATACDRLTDKSGNWVLRSQTGTKFESVGMLLIQKDGSISTGLITEHKEKEERIVEFISAIQSQYDDILQTVIGHSDVELTIQDPETGNRRVRSGETNLGDLCADAYLYMTGADCAFTNGGGVRDSISAGDITYEDILKVHPFGNAVCVVETTGLDILNALEMGCYNYPNEDGSFPQVAGITFDLNSDVPPSVVIDENGMFLEVTGNYRVQNVMIQGMPLELDKTYLLASHDYFIKEGGGGMNMFQDDTLLQDSVMLDNQILIQYITDYLGGLIGSDYANPYGQGRINIR